jgi:hypothetical protein
VAHKVLLETDNKEDDSTEAQSKWRRLGDLALSNGEIELAEKCAEVRQPAYSRWNPSEIIICSFIF